MLPIKFRICYNEPKLILTSPRVALLSIGPGPWAPEARYQTTRPAIPYSSMQKTQKIRKCKKALILSSSHFAFLWTHTKEKPYHSDPFARKGGYHGTQHFVFRLSHFNAAIFRADNFCNCLNSSYASFGEKKIEIGRVVFALISIN